MTTSETKITNSWGEGGHRSKLVFGHCQFKRSFFLWCICQFFFSLMWISHQRCCVFPVLSLPIQRAVCVFHKSKILPQPPQRTVTNIDNIFYHLLCGRTKVQHSTGGLQVGPTTHFQIFFPPLLAVLKLQHYSKVHFPPTLSFTFSFGRWQRRVSPLCSGSVIRSRRFLLCTTLLLRDAPTDCSIRVLSKT